MTKVYSPPHFGKLQIWDDQSLLRNTPPPPMKIVRESKSEISEYRELLHVETLCTTVIILFFIHLTHNEPSPSIRYTNVLKGEIARARNCAQHTLNFYILPHTICSDFPDNNIYVLTYKTSLRKNPFILNTAGI